ncbi:hypothetical protein RD792_011704 [Penstemon davidsonii]|uniref:TF-B3 domain-containing protein n=1 Tax=Penstemon davidsonii TaxID=160366 RepID=A0ABR0CUV8_9LAMI|nr:hypothetical protein RD792_011704 [Penstemon davidsonii]
MSINHYSSPNPWPSQYMMLQQSSPPNTSSSSATTATFWSATPQPPYHRTNPRSFNLDNNNDEDGELRTEEEEEEVEDAEINNNNNIIKDPLFEKPLTPSDVGKLNRLVIPKQYAEKYFPLNGVDSNEKGLLLGFEDEVGKSWRFRYSYWNSSQSYVLTKGWSRFVKEKKLDAGDVVLFLRHRLDFGRLFIGWRRRRSSGGEDGGVGGVAQPGGWNRGSYSSSSSGHPAAAYPSQHQGLVLQKQSSTIKVNGNFKRLRLFGVNLDCQTTDESSETEGSFMSSLHQGQPLHHHPYHQYYN